MPGALVAFGTDGRALGLNRTAQDLLGFDEASAVGLDAGNLLGDEADEQIASTLATGRPAVGREVMLRTATGAPLPARLTTSRLRDEQDHAYGALATFLDLTPLRAACAWTARSSPGCPRRRTTPTRCSRCSSTCSRTPRRPRPRARACA